MTGKTPWVLSFAAAVLIVGAQSAAGNWRVIPEVRVSGGNESDLVLDPALNRTIVPGGSFVEVTPAIAARQWVGRQALLDLGTFATAQRFFNSESRLLYAQTFWADLLQSFARQFRVRLSGSFDYFDDSERETVRRLGGGGELGLSFVQPRWNAELWGGINGRSYPRLDVLDEALRIVSYNETAWTGGGTLRAVPQERIAMRADGIFQQTDANDPNYDADSWTAFASVDLRVVSSWFLSVSGTMQERQFTKRLAGTDTDQYWQIGAGLRYTVAPGWTATVRYGLSEYTWPDGSAETTDRLAIGINYVWGKRSAAPPPTVDMDALTESGGSVRRADNAGNVRFRVHANGATRVSVAGDFNNWKPDATPMRARGDGWWEAHIELAPGTYEYGYWIDEEWVTPPEATLTVDDGFGRKNGILEVLSPAL